MIDFLDIVTHIANSSLFDTPKHHKHELTIQFLFKKNLANQARFFKKLTPKAVMSFIFAHLT